jgi:PAX-interacting protein 1
VPTVSVQWLNDVLFSTVNAVQCMNNPKYHNFRPDEPLRIDYSLVTSLMMAWKSPIRVTPVSGICLQGDQIGRFFAYT